MINPNKNIIPEIGGLYKSIDTEEYCYFLWDNTRKSVMLSNTYADPGDVYVYLYEYGIYYIIFNITKNHYTYWFQRSFLSEFEKF